jgi:hypothetical protein
MIDWIIFCSLSLSHDALDWCAMLAEESLIAKSINFDLILWIDFGYMTLFLSETGRENRYHFLLV